MERKTEPELVADLRAAARRLAKADLDFKNATVAMGQAWESKEATATTIALLTEAKKRAEDEFWSAVIGVELAESALCVREQVEEQCRAAAGVAS